MLLEILIIIVVIKSIADLEIYHNVYDLFSIAFGTIVSLKPLSLCTSRVFVDHRISPEFTQNQHIEKYFPIS